MWAVIKFINSEDKYIITGFESKAHALKFVTNNDSTVFKQGRQMFEVDGRHLVLSDAVLRDFGYEG